MASYTLSPIGGAGSQFFDNSGNVLSGGKLYTYAAGTTTPQTTWTTPAGNVQNSNPIILNAAGRPANEIWLSVAYSYKFVIKDSNDVLIATYDNIPGLPQPAIVNDASSISYEQGNTVTAGSFVIGNTYMIASLGTTDFVSIGAAYNSTGQVFIATGVGSGTGTAYNSQTVQSKLQQTVSVKDFGAVGDGVTDDTAAIQAALTYCVANGKDLFSPAGTYLYTPVSTLVLDLESAAKGGFKIYGEGDASRWNINANNVIFDVRSSGLDANLSPLYVENMRFELLNPSTNTNATLFYITRRNGAGGGAGWSCRFHVDACAFWRWTNTAVKAVMAFNSTVKNSYFHGANTDGANGGTGTFAAYNDAGVRLWGGAGDGTGTPRFSNLCEIDTCTFRLSRYGIETYSALWCKVVNCTFDPVWIGLAAKPNNSPSNTLGTQSSLVEMSGNWFEDQTALGYVTKWYFTALDIDFATGNDIAGTASAIQNPTDNFYNNSEYVKRNVYPQVRQGSTYVQKYGGVQNQSLLTYDPTYVFFKGQHFRPSETYYEFRANGAYFAPNIQAGNIAGRYVGSPGSFAEYSKVQIEGVDRSASISVVRNSDNSSPAYLTFAKSRGTTVGSNTIVQNGDTIARIDFAGADGNTTYSIGASIAAIINGSPAINNMPTDLVLYSTASGATPTERVRVKSLGSVRFKPITQPALAEAGDVYYDIGTNKLRCYNGSIWNDLF